MRTFGYEPRIRPNTQPFQVIPGRQHTALPPAASLHPAPPSPPQPPLNPQVLPQPNPKPSPSNLMELPLIPVEPRSAAQFTPQSLPIAQPWPQQTPDPQPSGKGRFSLRLPWFKPSQQNATEPAPGKNEKTLPQPSLQGQTLESLLSGNPSLQQTGIYFVKQFGPPLLRQFGPPVARRLGLPIAKRLGPPLARRVGMPLLKRVGLPLARKAGMFLIKRIIP